MRGDLVTWIFTWPQGAATARKVALIRGRGPRGRCYVARPATQEDLASEKVMQIENSVVKEIRAGHPVSRTSMSLQEALSRGDIVTIPCEKYPSKVTLVQIGDCEMAVSRELCRGTHVLNTRDIEDFCITRVTKVSRGIKRIYAVTGIQASEAHHAGEQLMKLCAELEAAVKTRCQSVNKIQEFTARIHQAHLAGKPVTKLREELMAAIKTQSQGAARMQELSTCIHQMTRRELTPYVAREHVMFVVKPLDTYVTEAANFQKLIKLRTMVEDLLLTDRESNFVLQSMKFEGKQILKALSMLETDRPLVLISPDKTESAVTFVWPKDHFPVITEAELKYILGNEHSVQIKSSVNKAGHSVVLAIVKGKDLGERLVKKVKNIMSFKTR